MINTKQIRLLLFFSLAAVLFPGCVTHKPVFIRKDFDSDKVGRIAVLPFLDGRQHPDPGTDFKYIASEATTVLIPMIKYKPNYLAFDTTDIGDVTEYSAHAIEPSKGQYAPPDFVKQLGPSQAKWVMVPVCEDLGRWNAVLYAGGSARLSLYLFNKETGELWWKETAAGSMSIGGLTGGLADALDKYGMETGSIIQCEQALMNALPPVKNTVAKRGGGNEYMARRYSIDEASDMQRIAVTSVVDGRRRESKKIVYDPKAIQDQVLKILHKKGYDGFAVQGFGQQEAASKAQVALADVVFGKSLAGAGGKYVLIPVADDVSNPPELVGKHYELSFYLFNTESGELIWEGSGFGKSLGNALSALANGGGLPIRKDLMKKPGDVSASQK